MVAVEVSALKKTNIDELLSVINLQSELLELKAVKENFPEKEIKESN